MKKIADVLFKYRYLVAFLAVLLGVTFKLNGSSIGCLLEKLGAKDNGLLFGVSREIRGDEYATFLPMTWAQYYDPAGAFRYFSSVVRGTSTDVFLEYGQPVFSLLMIFRPFQIGYLFLSVERGMSFFWCMRLVVLFMVSFEFGRLITRGKKLLALIYSLMVTFAPGVQWWFAINGLVEMIVSVELSITLLSLYRKASSLKLRILLAFGIFVSAGCFILTMYPAWMVPLFYLLIMLIIWQFTDKNDALGISDVSNKDMNEKKSAKKYFLENTLICIFFSALLIAALLYVYHKSADTINTILHTAYPGNRIETGGGDARHLFNYVADIWYAVRGFSPYYNVCESAYFIDLFPLGFFVYLFYIVRSKKQDTLSTLLSAAGLFLLIYIVAGFPGWLAKITFLSYTTSNRALLIFSFINLILLFRGAANLAGCPQSETESVLGLQSEKSESEKSPSEDDAIHLEIMKPVYIMFSIILPLTSILLVRSINPTYFSLKAVAVTFVIFAFLSYGFTAFGDMKKMKVVWVVLLTALMLAAGGMVNPIRYGAQDVSCLPELEMAEEIAEKDRGALWIVEGESYGMNNLLLLKGIPTVNSINVYPALDRWRLLDPEGRYEKIYNRYAHIEVKYVPDHKDSAGNDSKEKKEKKFKLLHADTFRVKLTSEDLKLLGVRYIFTASEITDEDAELVGSSGNYHVYRVRE